MLNKTLKQSLADVLENPKEYLADVYFEYSNNSHKIWAHKAILIVRVPEFFRNQYMPQLKANKSQENEQITSINISDVIPCPTMLTELLHVWYLAEFSSDQAQKDIESLEETLETKLVPITEQRQWKNDLKRMMDERISVDVIVDIFQAPPGEQTVFAAHRFMLASQSPYFHNVLLTKEFTETSMPSVHLSSDIVSPCTLQIILDYIYTETLFLPPLPQQQRQEKYCLNEKRHDLRLLLQVFIAADYLGHQDTICKAVLTRMRVICHQFKCVCPDCLMLLPFMLYFADRHDQRHEDIASLRLELVSLYSSRIESLAPLWSQKPFAILVNENSQHTNQKQHAIGTHNSIMLPGKKTVSVTDEIVQKTWSNITKQNSIRVLHSFHLCLSALRGADPLPTWSQALLTILIDTLLAPTIERVANDFEYYCVDESMLLSCIDGNAAFSVDFLEFVLKWVLKEDMMNDANAAKLYQAVVRDLCGRQEMSQNVAMDRVLGDARRRCVNYLLNHWMNVKATGGFMTVDLDVLKSISEDIQVPMRMLMNKTSTESSKYTSSLSVLFRFIPVRKRSSINPVTPSPSSMKTILNGYSFRDKRTRSMATTSLDGRDSAIEEDNNVKLGPCKPSTPTISLIDALLPPMDPVYRQQQEKEKPIKDYNPTSRQIRFALPDPPTRNYHRSSPVTVQKKKKKKEATKKKGRRWSLGGSSITTSDDDDEDENLDVPQIGYKVELLRRPLPTLGTIKYIGDVEFARGIWVGVELESRLGNSDGSVEGKRYFKTFPQRGVFVKIDDFKIISTGKKK
ncbi:MAG: hypothetical protein EXX96DRAFT_525142 [Benjaminiella poitrasii]|nr:MAG: hypothetical protein EXX96DRAFT_525142 [Benjaminiella poitrasii]